MNGTSKNEKKTKGRLFQPGNKFGKGRPLGSRNKASIVLQSMIEGEGEDVVRSLIKQALDGNTAAAKILVERIVPPAKERAVSIELPKVVNATDAINAATEVLANFAAGEITPSEMNTAITALTKFSGMIEAADFDKRLTDLEEQFAERNSKEEVGSDE